MKKEDIRELLWEDYLALVEKYQDDMSAPEFGYALIEFTVKMLADTAPKPEQVQLLIVHAIQSALQWSEQDLAEQNKGESHE
jgi:hypothetical protein